MMEMIGKLIKEELIDAIKKLKGYGSKQIEVEMAFDTYFDLEEYIRSCSVEEDIFMSHGNTIKILGCVIEVRNDWTSGFVINENGKPKYYNLFFEI
jgi:hypothetical protein